MKRRIEKSEELMTSMERVNMASCFIHEHDIHDEDVCQEIYLLAVESSDCSEVELSNKIMHYLADNYYKVERDDYSKHEVPIGLLLNIDPIAFDDFSDIGRTLARLEAYII